MVADAERRVTLLENVRSCREGAAAMNPVGVHHPAGASNAQSDRLRSTVAALNGVDQEAEGA